MITIHTLTYNEELILPKFINHYRYRFPNCKIVIYDNESTDSTVQIAKEYDCDVINNKTGNELSDKGYLKIKNNCWKNSTTKWNLICDCDEFCLIDSSKLFEEELNGTNIIKFKCFDMVNTSIDPSNIEIDGLTNGVRNQLYDKTLLFNKDVISEINYSPGCHISSPIGYTKYSEKDYIMLHYKYIGEDYLVERYRLFNSRLSSENKLYGWGTQYTENETKIREKFKQLISKSEKIEK